jgi:hypothetical protein
MDYKEGTLATVSKVNGNMPLALRNDAKAQRAGTNLYRGVLSADTYGALRVNPENCYPIYSVGLNVDPASAATDVFVISPASTAILGIRRIILSGTIATTAADQLVKLIRRITLDTSGTATVPTGVPRDSGFSAATAVMALYTANPTLGTVHSSGAATPDGNMAIRRMAASVAGGTAIPSSVDFDFRDSPIILRATTSQLAINLLGTSQNLVNLDIYVEWDERPTSA